MPEQGLEADTRSAFALISLSRTRRVFDVVQANLEGKCGRMDLDSHADTCCAGDNTRVVSFTGEQVNVAPFSEAYDALKDIPIATVATVWECPKTMEGFLLIINEALYFGKKLKVSLLCPNQLRNHGIQVNDTPKQFDKKSTHSIRTEKGQEIPLELDGVISYLQTRKPTIEEIHDFNTGIGL
jgi:hypothetical protein